MPAAESSSHLERHMAYSQHQGKSGPSRPGPPPPPPPHLVPHHAPHPPPPSASYGPPPPQHGAHPGYGHHGPPANHRGPPMPNAQQQVGPQQVSQGSQQRSQVGSGMQHGPPPPHGSHNQRVPPGMMPPHGVSGPSHGQHKITGPHGQYLPPHVSHGGKLGNDRSEIANSEPRQPPAYPEPPRYPGSNALLEDADKQPPPSSSMNGPQGQSAAKQYSGNLSGGSGPVMNNVNSSASGGVSIDIAKLEEELSCLSRNELIGRALKVESECRDFKHTFHQQAGELRHLRENNQRLTDDNQELRDLCCFLDDDRQKGRKLAREWQRFGRYTASVMRQEVTAYQNKLRELDTKQQELIKDNLELKELCLYLDEERSNAACTHCGHPLITRDDGDGSSSSTNADEPSGPPPSASQAIPQPSSSVPEIPLARSSSRERLLEDTLNRQRSPMNEQVTSYIRSLEARVVLLETEKQQLVEELSKVDRSHPEGEVADSYEMPYPHPPKEKSLGSRPPQPPPYSLSHHMRAVGLGLTNRTPLGPGSAESDDELLDGPPPPPLVSRPTAVAAAMRVLELQEQLDGSSHPSGVPPHSQGPPPPPLPGNAISGVVSPDAELADGEKALLRQMCNVVWKKLEEVPSQHR